MNATAHLARLFWTGAAAAACLLSVAMMWPTLDGPPGSNFWTIGPLVVVVWTLPTLAAALGLGTAAWVSAARAAGRPASVLVNLATPLLAALLLPAAAVALAFVPPLGDAEGAPHALLAMLAALAVAAVVLSLLADRAWGVALRPGGWASRPWAGPAAVLAGLALGLVPVALMALNA